MHTVRAPDHGRVAFFTSAADDGPEQRGETCVNERSGITHLQCECSVNDVAAGEAVVNPATLWANALRELIHEGDDVMISSSLQLVDACDIDLRLGADYRNGVGRHFARCSLRVEHREFYLQRRTPARLIAPDGRH